MLQSRSTALSKHQNEDEEQLNKDKTNATCNNRRTNTEEL